MGEKVATEPVARVFPCARQLVSSPRWAHVWTALAGDIKGVDEWVRSLLQSRDGLLGEASRHLLLSSGKRLRPALLLLWARLGKPDPERVLPVAAAVELVHMATLVHDDIIDQAPTRRGWPTVNAAWNERVAVLLGDYLFSRALTLAARYGGQQVVDLLAEAVEEMCQGEMEQEAHRFDPDQGEEQYLARIGQKTARFLADCCRAGALLGGAGEALLRVAGEYGYSLGLAFQIIDDVLDFAGSRRELGKPVGGDLREGVVTLPVIYALAEDVRREWIRGVILGRQPAEEEMALLRNILQAGGYLERARGLAGEFRRQALEALAEIPRSPITRLLGEVANFVVERRF